MYDIVIIRSVSNSFKKRLSDIWSSLSAEIIKSKISMKTTWTMYIPRALPPTLVMNKSFPNVLLFNANKKRNAVKKIVEIKYSPWLPDNIFSNKYPSTTWIVKKIKINDKLVLAVIATDFLKNLSSVKKNPNVV